MGFDAILRASKDDDTEAMMAILKADPGLSQSSNGIGQTGLHVAAIWGNVRVATILIHFGADVNATNQFGLSPFHGCVQGDHLEMAELLIAAGADTQIRAGNGKKAIDVAKSDQMRLLCGGNALKGHAAVMAGDGVALEALLTSASQNISSQDSDGDTMLHLAVMTAVGDPLGDAPLVQEVWEKANHGNSLMLDILLRHDQSPGFAKAQRLHNDAGKMPLHVAASRGNASVCEALLQANAPRGLINAVDLQRDELHNGQWGKKNATGQIERLSAAGSTSLHMAVQFLADGAEDAADQGTEVELDPSLVRLLLKHGADPNALDGEAQTPLHIAITGGLHEIVELLCQAKADVSLGCKAFGRDNTALHQAVIIRDLQMMKLLMDHGANVDALGRDGWTPLCMAVRSNACDCVAALLEANANVHTVCGNGKTALEIASKSSNATALVKLLQGHIAQDVVEQALQSAQLA